MTTHSETNAIIRDIDSTRDEIRGTLDELSNRLSVANLLDSAVRPASQGTMDFARSVGTAAQHNPLGLVITGVGLAWLMLSQRSTARLAPAQTGGNGSSGLYAAHRLDPNRSPERELSPKGPSMTDKIVDTVETAKDWSQEKLHQATDMAQKAGETAKEWAGSASQTAKGTAERVAHMAKDAAERVSHTTMDAADQASRTAKDLAGQASQTTKGVASRAASGLKSGTRATSDFIQEHPLAVGAAVVGVGALLAFTLSRGRGKDVMARAANDFVASTWSAPDSSSSEAEATTPEAIMPSSVYPTEDDRTRAYDAAAKVAESVAADARANDRGPEAPGTVRTPKGSPIGVLGQTIEDVSEASLAVGAAPIPSEPSDADPDITQTAQKAPGRAMSGKLSTGGAQASVPAGKAGTTMDSRPEKVTSAT